MSPIDLNLIRTFVTLYEAGSVTLAAERLFVTQPSVSYALARLRELFDDALFTRTRDGIQPTFVAEQLYGTFRESLTRIEGAVQSVRHFDPATTERRFRIALTDLGEVGFLSLILERLTRDAPFAEVEVLPLQVDEVGAWLSSAKVDAAICRQPVPGARSQRVLHERYVCLLSDRHPRIGDSLSLEQYLAERHIVVTRTSGHGIAEDVLEAMQVQRRISLRVPHFGAAEDHSRYRAADHPAGADRLSLRRRRRHAHARTPFTLPPFDVSLHWHESSERSAALNWFRTTIAEAIIAAQR